MSVTPAEALRAELVVLLALRREAPSMPPDETVKTMDRATTLLRGMGLSTPDYAEHWVPVLLDAGMAGVLEAVIAVATLGQLTGNENTLARLGQVTALAVRRCVLRRVCEDAAWDLPAVGKRLRIHGAAKVLRELEIHGLMGEYHAAVPSPPALRRSARSAPMLPGFSATPVRTRR